MAVLANKAEVLARLNREILGFQGYRPLPSHMRVPDLGPVNAAFPSKRFPLGCIHEFVCAAAEDHAATTGFIAGLTASIANKKSFIVWIGKKLLNFPPGLVAFGLHPEKIIFVDLQNERDCLWATEEALRCKGLAAVVCETDAISFTTSRRLQLAVEQSQVTGFVLCRNPLKLSTTTSIARWKISPMSSELEEDMPGIGHPRWNVELLRVRNGKTGSWRMEWNRNKFLHIPVKENYLWEGERKTG